MTVACVFDMDNTFALTSRADEQAIKQTFNSILTSDHIIDYETDIRGKDIGVVCDLLNSRFGLGLDQVSIRKAFRQNFNHQADLVDFTPGTLEAISKLEQAGVVRSLASNSSLVRISHVARRLSEIANIDISEKLNGGLYSALDHTPGRIKPHPDIFVFAAQKIMKEFSNSGFHFYFVEESKTGMDSAVAAKKLLETDQGCGVNVTVVGFTGDRVMLGKCPRAAGEELSRLGADICFDNMSDVADFICSSHGLESRMSMDSIPAQAKRYSREYSFQR